MSAQQPDPSSQPSELTMFVKTLDARRRTAEEMRMKATELEELVAETKASKEELSQLKSAINTMAVKTGLELILETAKNREE